MEGKVVQLRKEDREAREMEWLVYCAKRVVTAQTLYGFFEARDELQKAIEKYTGVHWPYWGI